MPSRTSFVLRTRCNHRRMYCRWKVKKGTCPGIRIALEKSKQERTHIYGHAHWKMYRWQFGKQNLHFTPYKTNWTWRCFKGFSSQAINRWWITKFSVCVLQNNLHTTLSNWDDMGNIGNNFHPMRMLDIISSKPTQTRSIFA